MWLALGPDFVRPASRAFGFGLGLNSQENLVPTNGTVLVDSLGARLVASRESWTCVCPLAKGSLCLWSSVSDWTIWGRCGGYKCSASLEAIRKI